MHRNVKVAFSNYGTVGIGEPIGIRVLSRRSISRSLSFLLPLCNEDTGPVTPALIFRGVTHYHDFHDCLLHLHYG
ncbi:hypothetical protein Hdeb2414_s0572g00918561 [Helianthus debilis subsp. tardiflorus]